MQELYNKLKKYTIKDAIKIEESDRQYIALKNLWSFNPKKSNYLGLIITNSIICYQLSGKGEDYWEELCKKILDYNHGNGLLWLTDFFADFLPNSKNNKRFIDTKLKRLKKLKPFLENFEGKEEYYYDNMEILRDELANTMKQKKDAKTIVFAVKMFSYGARNVFNKLEYFPENISAPIDSRLMNLFDTYKGDYEDITKFYFDLSKKLKIPELHLDALVWVNYNDLIK